MVNRLIPNYLHSLVPPRIGNSCSYNLRNPNNLRNIACRTCLYSSSFLPTVINDWNSLPDDIKNAESLSSFKYHINLGNPCPRGLYFYGDKEIQIIHARLRSKRSSLKEHLHLKNVVDSPLCRCGAVESTKHFFLECPFYNNQKDKMRQTINEITRLALQIILFGDDNLSLFDNQRIFAAVHTYIRISRRFTSSMSMQGLSHPLQPPLLKRPKFFNDLMTFNIT